MSRSLLSCLIGFGLLMLNACGGADSGTQNASCPLATASASPVSVKLQQVFTGLTFTYPMGMMQAPGDNSRWFLLEREGIVRVFANDPLVSTSSAFIDIHSQVDQAGEGGLLGMAFHPDFAKNGQVFLSYTRTGAPLTSYISRFTSTDKGLTLDPKSEQPILTLDQPYSNHDGGNIQFGPDGYLYIGFGDGGSGGDPLGNGQNTNTLFGAMLRIDVDHGSPYSIPATNPFVTGGGKQEIYAWGLRNPWRWSFDRKTNALWLGDVGQNAWEEVDCIKAGHNYGWNVREGAHCYNAATCDASGMTDPVAEYDHSKGCSIIGGYVYRGTAIPALQGAYVYGDYCNGRIWALFYDSNGKPVTQVLADSGINITSFGEGNNGEVYVMGSGKVYQIVAN